MFWVKFVRYVASITHLCHTYLITTFKILYLEYRPIYRISEFSSCLISASAPKSHIGLAPVRMEFKNKKLAVHGHTVHSSHSILFSRWLRHPFLPWRCGQRQLMEPVASIWDTSTLPAGHGRLLCKMILSVPGGGEKITNRTNEMGCYCNDPCRETWLLTNTKRRQHAAVKDKARGH